MDVLRPTYRRARSSWRRVTAPLRALPDYVIIGAQRSGSSTLARMLRSHPQIMWLAPPREVHWLDANPAAGLAWYRSHFPTRRAIARRASHLRLPVLVGEKTPEYLLHPTVPRRMAEVLPEARFLVVLRDPVQRALSHYFMNLRYGVEPLDLDAALDAEPERCDATFDAVARGDQLVLGGAASWAYVRRGCYLAQLERWWQAVPRERMHVLRAEDLYEEPVATFLTICSFLGIEPVAPADTSNQSRGQNRQPVPDRIRDRLAEAFAEPNRALEAATGISW